MLLADAPPHVSDTRQCKAFLYCGESLSNLTDTCKNISVLFHSIQLVTMAGIVNNLLEKLNLSSGEKKAPVQEPSEDNVNTLQEKYKTAGQEHVFKFYDELDTEGKASLYEQLDGFDPDRINTLADKALNPPKSDDNDKEPDIEPLPAAATASLLEADKSQIEEWYTSGLQLVADNKVGVVLMAGGQGTRLGSSDPKGCFDIGLPSHKSLFQMQGERILKAQQLAQKQAGKDEGVVVPWYVMTSGPTRGPTEKFFKDNGYFGLQEENVIIFEQGVLPCISNEGKILMENKSKVSIKEKMVRIQTDIVRWLLHQMETVASTKH